MHRLALTVVAATLAIALLSGCRADRDDEPGLRLRPTVPDAKLEPGEMFHVRVTRIRHRLRPDAKAEDIWRLLGTTSVPYEKRALWEANDLLLGEGARLAAERMNELITETPDRKAKTTDLYVAENFTFRLAFGQQRDELDIVWTDAKRRLRGRNFEGASTELTFVARPSDDDPDAVRLAILPVVLYGKQRQTWVETPTGYTRQMRRPRFELHDLAAEVELRPGRLVMISGERSSPVSIGGAFFYQYIGPDLWRQSIVITAEPVPVGAVPRPKPPEKSSENSDDKGGDEPNPAAR